MKDGKKDEAEAAKAKTGSLKSSSEQLNEQHKSIESRLYDLLVQIPNAPHLSVLLAKTQGRLASQEANVPKRHSPVRQRCNLHNFVIFPLTLEATLGITAIVPIVDNCVITVDSNPFIRGDANYDSIIGLADVVRILQILFVGQNAVAGTVVDCDDLLDADNSESLSIVDAIYVLQYLFGGGPAMDSPFPTCGPDTGPGTALTCDVSPPNCVP